ncbi:MAG: hypothetical protein A2Y38_01200 [Spirochaetes bacterium GWB1_59_5]|nr:MAG: hypothetical protein A2Y38_01200 [Spirochaetes bacterium GWB1_59_5]
MKIVQPSFAILTPIDGTEMLRHIEECGRVCYQSSHKITPDSHIEFVRRLITSHHESVLEHTRISVRFVCDRAVGNEMVRHRLASYSQESTRYVSSVALEDYAAVSDTDIVAQYQSGLSMRKIAERSAGKYTEWQVYKVLDAAEVACRPQGNTGVVHDDFFDIIDTVEKAYLLGVVQADGSIRPGASPQVSITQHEDYAWYLHRMVTDFIRPGAQTSRDRNCRQITFTSQRVRAALIRKGVVPNKSYDQTSVDIDHLWASIPSSLLPAFLRGFLDGDGWIRFFCQGNVGHTDSCRIGWSGQYNLMLKIASWLRQEFAYAATVQKVSGTKQLYRVSVSKPSVGDALVRRLLVGFRWPYGHPVKVARMIERVGGVYPVADFGDVKFEVIMPSALALNPHNVGIWLKAMDSSERAYHAMRMAGSSPQIARSVLPLCLKTDIVMTTNLRHWREVFRQRCAKAAHPQIRELMIPLLGALDAKIPVVFEDLHAQFSIEKVV